MALFDYLAMLFINTFGITQPTEVTRRRATFFIFFLLLLMLAGVVAISYAFYVSIHR